MRIAILALAVVLSGGFLQAAEERPPASSPAHSRHSAASPSKKKAPPRRRTKYQQAIQKELSGFHSRISALKTRAEKLDAEKRQELSERITLLEGKARLAEKRLTDLKSAGGASWEKLKSGLDRAVIDLRKTYQKTLNQLRSE